MRLPDLRLERPIVQAGMGGGIARHELAAAVSEAGGLGTIGMLAPARLREELAAARQLTGAPIAVNLLLPFVGRGHWEVAQEADAVVTFWGEPRRRTSRTWLHQCGSVDEARAAEAAGAEAVILQGVEAGGHVRGRTSGRELLERTRAALRPDTPLLLAGGIADGGDVADALEAGASAAVLGTRFLLSQESRAHALYKQAALRAPGAVLTDLFGVGWPVPHRVLHNAATERWLDFSGEPPPVLSPLQRTLTPVVRRLPDGLARRAAAAQRPGVCLFSPVPPTDDAPLGRLLDAGPLYAGQTVARISDVRPAAELVADLTP